jgi:predicted  nucleic acid-binding Zn-ribbon protein
VAASGRPARADDKGVAGIAALVRLAELDAEPPAGPELAAEQRLAARRALVARLSHDLKSGYERALLAGRQPPVVRLSGSGCAGCYVRLPTILEQRIRFVRGVAACPRCLRLVYDPEWLGP